MLFLWANIYCRFEDYNAFIFRVKTFKRALLSLLDLLYSEDEGNRIFHTVGGGLSTVGLSTVGLSTVGAVYHGGCLPWGLSTQLHGLKLQTQRIPQKRPWPFLGFKYLYFIRSKLVAVFSFYLSSRPQYSTKEVNVSAGKSELALFNDLWSAILWTKFFLYFLL